MKIIYDVKEKKCIYSIIILSVNQKNKKGDINFPEKKTDKTLIVRPQASAMIDSSPKQGFILSCGSIINPKKYDSGLYHTYALEKFTAKKNSQPGLTWSYFLSFFQSSNKGFSDDQVKTY